MKPPKRLTWVKIRSTFWGDEYLKMAVGEPRSVTNEVPYDFLELYSGTGNMSAAWTIRPDFGYSPQST